MSHYRIRVALYFAFLCQALLGPSGGEAGDRLDGARTDPTANRPPIDRLAALSASMLGVPRQYRPPMSPGKRTSPSFAAASADFQAFGRSPTDGKSAGEQLVDAPMAPDTSVWRRMAESRTNKGVRLLNLWIFGGNSVSLQAGRKGEPSLQWMYRPIDLGGAGSGLLDPLFSESIRAWAKKRPAAASVRRPSGRP